MIIDKILDRKEGVEYTPKKFYSDVVEYGEIGNEIALSLDSGEEKDVKEQLCRYILGNNYNPKICEYVNSVNWL